jgi:SAM-dependent methyltransferase
MTADEHVGRPGRAVTGAAFDTGRRVFGEAGRTVFGVAAEAYDAGRPGYHPALVGQVLDYAGPAERTAVEVGAGTGKATVLFAEAGVAVTCLEPDARMADVLRRNTAAYPAVGIEVSSFEDWQPGDRRFGMLLAATSWHWVDRSRGWDLVEGALTPDGVVAFFWNPQGVLDPELHAELASVDARHGVADSPHSHPASAYGPAAGDWSEAHWPATDRHRFRDVREVRLREEVRYDTERYLMFLDSVSTYRLLPDDRRDRALADTADLLNRRGGGISMLHVTDLFLGRPAPRRVTPASRGE